MTAGRPGPDHGATAERNPGVDVRQLNHDFKEILARHPRERSHGTRRGRAYALDRMATALDRRFPRLRAWNLKGRHVEFLVADWKERRLSAGTMANYMSHLRWFARAIGKPNIVRRSNAAYGIAKDRAAKDRACGLPAGSLSKVKDAHVRMALRMELAFGLRREEAIKFSPSYSDRGSRIVLKASTTKGGRPRRIPVLKEGQRRLLDEVRELVGGGALIPAHRNYREQLRVYETRTRDAGLRNMHGLRYEYAQRRYEDIAGWKCPLAGGPPQGSLTGARERIDRQARTTVARELGHNRRTVSETYLGK